MRVGVVVTDPIYLPHVLGTLDAARNRGWQSECFLTDTAVLLLSDSAFLERARAYPRSVAVCEHSIDRFASGWDDLGDLADFVVMGGQYQDAELVQRSDRVLVF